MDLDIHIRTTTRYDYSYIDTAVLRIGDETLEVTSWGEYAINRIGAVALNSHGGGSVRRGDVVSTLGGYPIFHTKKDDKMNVFEVMLPHNQTIVISNLKDLVSVKINHASRQYFGNAVGLLGNFHGTMLARDGVTDLHDDSNAMGQEWQVRDTDPMLFRSARAPQFPAKCRLPDVAEKEARRLGEGISEEAAEIACAHVKGEAQAFAACVYDVTATNDLDQAGAY